MPARQRFLDLSGNAQRALATLIDQHINEHPIARQMKRILTAMDVDRLTAVLIYAKLWEEGLIDFEIDEIDHEQVFSVLPQADGVTITNRIVQLWPHPLWNRDTAQIATEAGRA